MTSRAPRFARSGCIAAAVAAVALALPAGAAAAVGGPWALTGTNGTSFSAAPVTAASALVVQATQVGSAIDFSPMAVNTAGNPLPAGCTNNVIAVKTTCTAAPAVSLSFSGAVVEAGAHDLTTGLVSFTGGIANDIFRVDGGGSVGSVVVDPRDGADAITVAGNVQGFVLAGPDPGDDRYDIQSDTLSVATPPLLLGAGNDVAANRSPNLEIHGGTGDDTLSGPGDLFGDAGNDLIEPTVTTKVADGGAGIDRLSFELVGTPLTIAMTPTQMFVNGSAKVGFETLEGGAANDTITGSSVADDISGGDGNDTIDGGGGADRLDGGPGDNTVSYAAATGPVTVDLAAGTGTTGGVTDTLSSFRGVITGAGDDTVIGTSADEHFDLGAGNDTINAGPGNDVIAAGPGDDLVRGGHGTDIIDGGPGRDTATYDERTASEPINVTLATPGGDGAAGENDTLLGIENVIGGASSDVLVGDDGPNTLVGGGGLNTLIGGAGDDVLIGGDFRDVIVGGPGRDQMYGGGDDDSIDAFDGEPDIVDCGPSLDDDAQVDAFDQVSGCEYARRGDVPVPVDADGDGSVPPFDCDDTNPAIGVLAKEIPGDGIDQNCDGFDEPLGLVAGGLRLSFAPPTARGTRITQLVLTELQRDSSVLATCKTAIKRRCPFTRSTRKPQSAGAQVSLTALLKRRVLPVGTRVELRITAPGVIGRVRRFTIRQGAAPRVADLCVLPGSSVAKTCPPDVL